MLSAQSLLGRVVRAPLRLIPKGAEIPVLMSRMGVFSRRPRLTWWRVASSTHGCWIGWYEREVQEALSYLLRPGAVLYDIGANVGFFTLLAARLVGPSGRVVAFEPEPSSVSTLRYHVARNWLDNVIVVDAAASDQEGIAMLSGSGSAGRLGGDAGTPVSTVTIDAYCRRASLPAPDVIKLDVEGWEFPVLTGMHETLQTTRPVLLIEFHGSTRNGVDWDTTCRDYLTECDYRLTRMGNGEFLAIPRGHRAESLIAGLTADS